MTFYLNGVALDVEQVVAGFVNTSQDGREFGIADLKNYLKTLYNAGCGAVFPEYTEQQLYDHLDKLDGVCLRRKIGDRYRYIIDKSNLGKNLSEKEKEIVGGHEELFSSLDLFIRLHVNPYTPDYLLDDMGFQFVYKDI